MKRCTTAVILSIPDGLRSPPPAWCSESNEQPVVLLRPSEGVVASGRLDGLQDEVCALYRSRAGDRRVIAVSTHLSSEATVTS